MISAIVSSGSSDRKGGGEVGVGGPRNMKSIQMPLVGIFLFLFFILFLEGQGEAPAFATDCKLPFCFYHQ